MPIVPDPVVDVPGYLQILATHFPHVTSHAAIVGLERTVVVLEAPPSVVPADDVLVWTDAVKQMTGPNTLLVVATGRFTNLQTGEKGRLITVLTAEQSWTIFEDGRIVPTDAPPERSPSTPVWISDLIPLPLSPEFS